MESETAIQFEHINNDGEMKAFINRIKEILHKVYFGINELAARRKEAEKAKGVVTAG